MCWYVPSGLLLQQFLSVFLHQAFLSASTLVCILIGVLGKLSHMLHGILSFTVSLFRALASSFSTSVQLLMAVILIFGLMMRSFLTPCQVIQPQIHFQHQPADITPLATMALQVTKSVVPQMIAHSVLALGN